MNLVSMNDASISLNLSRDRIRELSKSGKLKYVKVTSNRFLYDLDSIEKTSCTQSDHYILDNPKKAVDEYFYKLNKNPKHKPQKMKAFFDEIQRLVPWSASFNEAAYCISNDITNVPLCPILGKQRHYVLNTGYFDFSKEIFNLYKKEAVKKNNNVENSPIIQIIKNSNISSFCEIEKIFKNKDFRFIRMSILSKNLERQMWSPQLIFSFLEKNSFTPSKINQIINLIDKDLTIRNIEILKTHKILEALHSKNSSLNWYLFRGYTEEEAKHQLSLISYKGANKTKQKRQKDQEYNLKYLKQKSDAAKCVKHHFQSKMEKAVITYLEKYGFGVRINQRSKLEDNEKIIFSKNHFCHDIVINKSLIEYNGSYWHRDITRFGFSFRYCLEIFKFYISLKNSNGAINYSMVIWEDDESSLDKITKNIMDFLENPKKFFSNRKIDNLIFEEFEKGLSVDEVFNKFSKEDSLLQYVPYRTKAHRV